MLITYSPLDAFEAMSEGAALMHGDGLAASLHTCKRHQRLLTVSGVSVALVSCVCRHVGERNYEKSPESDTCGALAATHAVWSTPPAGVACVKAGWAYRSISCTLLLQITSRV